MLSVSTRGRSKTNLALNIKCWSWNRGGVAPSFFNEQPSWQDEIRSWHVWFSPCSWCIIAPKLLRNAEEKTSCGTARRIISQRWMVRVVFKVLLIQYSVVRVVLPVHSRWNEAQGLQTHFFFSGCVTAASRSKVSCLSPRLLFTYMRTANVFPLPVHTVGLQIWAGVRWSVLKDTSGNRGASFLRDHVSNWRVGRVNIGFK